MAVLLTLALTAALAFPPGAPPAAPVVDAAWLREHVSDANIVLLHVGPAARYAEAHIPGARYTTMSGLSTSSESRSLELPPLAQLDSTLESLGISDDSRIVLYWDQGWVTPTTRTWLTLDRVGLGDRVSILDGGLDAWRAAGGAVTSEAPATARPGHLTPHLREVTVEAKYVAAHLRDAKVTIVDARTPQFYDGSDAGGQPRPGHIPGARNVPYVSFVDETDHFLPEDQVRRLFAKAGVTGEGRVVVYCHIGQQATLAYFSARRLGYDVRLYDGSFEEWSRLDDEPVVQLKQARARLMTTEHLARMVSIPEWKVTVIDARSDLGAYLEGHIPGAVFLHNETLRWTGNGVPADLLPAESYRALFERLGVRRDRPVVIYSAGDQADFHASFIAWLLRGFGHPQVYLLDGGLVKWKAEQRPVTQEYPVVEGGSLAGKPFAPALVGTEEVHRAVTSRSAVLVDARPPAQYTGQAGPQMRRGHIPGAISHPWIGDLQGADGQWAWKKVEALKAAYAAQGVTPDHEIIVYCNTGTEASHLYFALSELLEYPRVRVYVPSWTAWAADQGLPVE